MSSDLTARVDALTACPHVPEIRTRLDRAGRARYVRQCRRCGERIGLEIPRRLVTGTPPPYDEAAAQRRIEQRNQAWTRASTERRQQELSTWRAQHDAYLRSPAWRQRRAAVLRRAQGRCEGCGTAAATQVHHTTYRRWQREMLFDLVAVCDACHRAIHADDRDAEVAC